MKRIKDHSLKTFFRRQAVRWSLISLCSTLLFAVPAFIWVQKIASEKNVETLAQSSASAFRIQILNGLIRDTQPKMIEALKLKDVETVLIRDANLNLMYDDGNQHPPVRCRPHQLVCWIDGYSKIERLEPIYSDIENKYLFGYIDFIARPVFDRTWVFAFLGLIPLIFLIQVLGLINALNNSSEAVTKGLSQWSKHINEVGDKNLTTPSLPPFDEFLKMYDAIAGLHNQIRGLQAKSAKDAKAAGQLAILRHVGHEFNSPLSKLAKYWAMLSHNLTNISQPVPGLSNHAENITKIISRMENISRQIEALHRAVSYPQNALSETYELTEEIKNILSELKQSDALEAKNVQLKFVAGENIPPAQITKIGLFGIIENLIKNSAQAIQHEGNITVSVESRNGVPTLLVTDNGSGIAPEIREKIFDFDFTTKGTMGSGLGLGIVKLICDGAGAKIDFESKAGEGTRFQVAFKTVPHEIKDTPHAV